MGYLEKNLNDGEVIIYRANISWAIFFRVFVLLSFLIWLSSKIHAIVVFLMVVISFIVVFRIIITIVTTEYALTDRRLIGKKGFIKRRTMEFLLRQIESVTISQPLDGRIFGFGTVMVTGSGGSSEHFHSISFPFDFQKQVNNQITKLS